MVAFEKIEKLAHLSRERGLSGAQGFRNQVHAFNTQLQRRFKLAELRQVPEYHKLIGSTQQPAYQPIKARAEIEALIEEFLHGLEERWGAIG